MGTEELEAARAAQLRYVSDSRPGIRRRAAGSGFVYLETEGRPVEEEVVLARIKSLAIPPAWTEVWICRLSHGHLQASVATRAVASNIAITHAGAKCVMNANS